MFTENNNIGIITDKDINEKIVKFNNPRKRIAARGIILRNDGKVAIFNKMNKNEYKLPGGGVEKGEDVITAFKREMLEETGCNVEIIKYLGTIKEEKSNDNFIQISHVYVAKVISDTGKLSLTKKEIEEGGRVLWVTKREALDLISKCFNSIKPSKYENLYHSKFIVLRDKKIIEYYINNESDI